MSLKLSAKRLEQSLKAAAADPEIEEIGEIFPIVGQIDPGIMTIFGVCCGQLLREDMTPEQLGVMVTLLGRALKRAQAK